MKIWILGKIYYLPWGLSIAGALLMVMFSGNFASAEFYIGGQIGGNFPLDFSDVEFSAGGVNGQSTDIELEDSLAYGGKIGYFFSSLNWLGVEA